MKIVRTLFMAQALAASILLVFAVPRVYAEPLQEEFEQLCIHTQEAETLPLEKLRELLADCDRLRGKIVGSNDGKKKLLLFRLSKCRNFYAYMIELKESKAGSRQ